MLGQCPRLDPCSTQTDDPRCFRLDIDDMDVEVHPVLGLLRFGNALQKELRTRLPAGRHGHRFTQKIFGKGLRPGRELFPAFA